VQKDIDAQVLITQTFGSEASKAVGNFAASRIDEIKAQQTTEMTYAIRWGKLRWVRLRWP
jgi:hypothetical protein